ncbi:MAG: class III signal peptide-containing protein [Candidatus Omnitrophica bacterium]|nr:class III signal peptide-containing protein [Candidatus Omnitrophota bacterium]
MFKRNIISKPGEKKAGQSTVEYIILVAAILAALIVFLKPGGIFQTRFNNAIVTGANDMVGMANRLSTSR